MTDPDFPEELRAFIDETIPSLDAAEMLVLLALHPEQRYSVGSVVESMRPTSVSEAAAKAYLQHFHERSLVVERDGDSYQYAPARPELDALVRALTRVYNERPVTLVRVIYASKDEKIRSFADAFRLKK